MTAEQRDGFLYAKRCPVCGKEFYPGPDWVYKDMDARGHPIIYCSWKCLRVVEKMKEKIRRKYKHRRIEQYTLDNKFVREYESAQDAAEMIGGTDMGIYDACRLSKKYKKYLWRYKKDELSEMQPRQSENHEER